jgi:hypothetical protein
LIGGVVNLDFLSLLPQNDSRIIGGIKGYRNLFKINNKGERIK